MASDTLFCFFNRIPNKIIYLILYDLVIFDSPVQIIYYLLNSTYISAISILSIYKRFYKVTERLFYQYNLFEFRLFYSLFYLDIFLININDFAYNQIIILRLY